MQDRHCLSLASTLTLAVLAFVPATARALDEGRLDAGWFDAQASFHETEEIDYFWVRPGFELAGKKLQFLPWPEPQFRGEDAGKRDEKDRRLARQMNVDMANVFADSFGKSFGGRLEASTKSGNVKVEGRIVDCSTGSTAAKLLVGMGAGAGNVTLDLRFVDAASGKVMAGLHQRVVSGTSWSTTDSKFVKWVDKMTRELASRDLATLYAKTKAVKK